MLKHVYATVCFALKNFLGTKIFLAGMPPAPFPLTTGLTSHIFKCSTRLSQPNFFFRNYMKLSAIGNKADHKLQRGCMFPPFWNF